MKPKDQVLNRIFTRAIVSILVIFMGVYNSLAAEIVDAKCEHLKNPTDVSIERLKFSWKLKSEKLYVVQTVYQILVFDNLNKLVSDEGSIWNSRKVVSDISIQLDYKRESFSNMLHGISHASTNFDSPYDLIKCNWAKKDNIMTPNVDIPVNMTAFVHLNTTPKSIILERDRGISDTRNIEVISKNSKKKNDL